MLRLIRRHPVKLFALTAATLLGVACSNNTTTENSRPEAASSSKITTPPGSRPPPSRSSLARAALPRSAPAKTIPYWSSSFTDPTNGVTYPYTMVGTNPFTTNASTTVPTVIIPFRFVFADGR